MEYAMSILSETKYGGHTPIALSHAFAAELEHAKREMSRAAVLAYTFGTWIHPDPPGSTAIIKGGRVILIPRRDIRGLQIACGRKQVISSASSVELSSGPLSRGSWGQVAAVQGRNVQPVLCPDL